MGTEPDDAAVKTSQAANFDGLNALVDGTPYGRHLRFLNFGYRPLPGETAAGPDLGRSFPNPESANLLFQTVGDVDLTDAVVVEVGCGRGGNLWLLQRHAEARHLVGIDLAASSIAHCARTVGATGASFAVGDAEAVPVGDQAADAVISIETACTYPDIETFFAEVARILRPGGHLLYADLLAVELVEPVVDALAAHGLDLLTWRDITANVVAARDLRADRQAMAFGPTPTSEWVGADDSVNRTRLGDGSVSYVLARFVRRAETVPPTERQLSPDQRARARAGATLSAELLQLPSVDAAPSP